MKKLILSRFKQSVTAGVLAAAFAVANVGYAGLQVPYTPDTGTLHLWHFDDSTANQGTANFVTVTDAVATASITLTNYGMGATSTGAEPRTPPYTNIFLVNQGYNDVLGTNLLNCLNILPGGGTAGKAYAWCGTTNNIGGYFSDTLSFRNPESGAFTFEAIVYIQGNVYSSSIGSEWEIFCGDSQGESGGRSWQFRLQPGATPSLNVNFISQTGGSASPNFTANLPSSGDNALTRSNWYHVAVAFTGFNPTNGNEAGILRFYWTFLSPYRTNAALLGSITNSAYGTLGGGPIPAVGGSARRNNGVGNAGAFEGLIDEVRISDIARSPSDMAFNGYIPPDPPRFVVQPPSSRLVGYGRSLSLPTLVSGGTPLYYQWQATNSSAGGWTNVPGQVGNSFEVSSVTFGDQGDYRLVVTNSVGATNSLVAQVTVGAAFAELFNTGIDTNGVYEDVNLPNNPDPHYILYRSADANFLGPNAIVWNMFTYPIAANGGFFANPDGASQWIGPQANSYTSPAGQYIYRTTFLLDSVDLGQPMTLSGTWWTGNMGTNILLNGQPTGITSLTNAQNTGSPFTITSGFVAGLNTLDFMVPILNPNFYQESALRVAISGIGRALPAGLPTINNPPANVTVRENGKASFSVVALGRPPLAYQWWADGSAVADATNRTLTYNPAFTGNQGTNFSVVISNGSGSITSSVVVLTLTTNRPPVPPAPINLITYMNNPVSASIATIIYGSTDADGDPISLAGFNSASTNGGTIAQNGIILTYTPVTDYVGADQYDYTISDGIDSPQGYVNITVLPLLAPTIATPSVAGSSLTLSGSGGAAGGSYRVMSSTNVVTPLAEWTLESSGVFNGSGNFSSTVPIASGVPEKFYVILVP